MHGHTLFARFLTIGALFVIAIISLALLLISFMGNTALLQDTTGLTRIGVGGTTVFAELATSTAAQEQGLSGTATLAPGRGMLFIFDRAGFYRMWMKDMNYPLDMVWISDEGVIVGMEKDLSPSTYPTTYVSSVPASSVLELPAGFIDAHQVKIGQRVTIF